MKNPSPTASQSFRSSARRHLSRLSYIEKTRRYITMERVKTANDYITKLTSRLHYLYYEYRTINDKLIN